MRGLGKFFLGLSCVLLAGCTDKAESGAPQTLQTPPGHVLECDMELLTEEAVLSPKVPRLWLDAGRSVVLRAYQFTDGRVVRNPYTLKVTPVSAALKRKLAEIGVTPDWPSVKRFHFQKRDELIFWNEGSRAGVLVAVDEIDGEETVPETGGEIARLGCRTVERDPVPPHVEIVPADPVILPPPPEGCADGSIDQTFGNDMVGCSGTVRFPDRATLCAPGFAPCTAQQWAARFANQAPKFNYWTDDVLRYSGSDGACRVSITSGSICQPQDSPMRLCAGTSDPLGNRCNWTRCGYETTVNQYFGGCGNHQTAGAACCK